jgi:hypothetical protein
MTARKSHTRTAPDVDTRLPRCMVTGHPIRDRVDRVTEALGVELPPIISSKLAATSQR